MDGEGRGGVTGGVEEGRQGGVEREGGGRGEKGRGGVEKRRGVWRRG